ncbi:hypothetical protein AB3K25_07290 [Leuconostoc sp. MS02]|uniref:Bacterial Pleckstrin homology domain-containing protein n=1 Tax=Leuconostoc aquikimchii TaxID=3236804 RepID=A0ABV3S1R6_9LACO
MENIINVQDNTLVVTPAGLTKIAALKEKISIPLSHIVGASIDTGILNDSKGFRSPGTAIPGYWAGTFRKDGDITFFNIKQSSLPVVIQLKDEHYNRLVIGVSEPREVVQTINNLVTK